MAPSPRAKHSTPQPVIESLGQPRAGRDELRLRLHRFTSGLVAAAHQVCREFTKAPSSLFYPLSPPCSFLLGVGVLTWFGEHHLVRVMPGRKSSPAGPRRSGRRRGRAFGRERKGGKRGGDAACCSSQPCLAHVSPKVPRLEEAPKFRRGFGACQAMWL